MKKRNYFKPVHLAIVLILFLPIATCIFKPVSALASEATPPNATGQKNGYNMAFAEPKTYDGTPYITISDITFADVLSTDDVHATARGTLSGCDVGTYPLVNIDQIVLSGADKDKYEGILPTSMQNVPINFEAGAVITKAQAQWTISCDKPEGDLPEYYTVITVTITNDFGNPDGLPDNIIFHTINEIEYAGIHSWTEFRSKDSNIYLSGYIFFGLNYNEDLQVWAEIPEDAKNYAPSKSPVLSIPILEPLADYEDLEREYYALSAALDLYTEESIKPLLAVFDKIRWDLKASQQDIVDQWFHELSKASNQLVLKPADYTKLQAVVSKVPKDLSLYTEETVQPLQELLASIDWDLPITEQQKITYYIKFIENAIKNLQFKPADYSEIQDLLASVPEDLTQYTVESIRVFEEAKDAIDWDLTIEKQSIVDNYAKNLKSAIASLTLKPEFQPADYTKVKEALRKIPSDLSIYTAESVQLLEDAKASIIWDLKAKDQKTVDSYAAAIEKAIQGLQKKLTQSPQPEASNPSQPAPKGQVSAKTGDAANLTLWILLFGCSTVVVRLSLKERKCY